MHVCISEYVCVRTCQAGESSKEGPSVTQVCSQAALLPAHSIFLLIFNPQQSIKHDGAR